MAELRDEYGNPIQLTDEHGNPVQLTDEHGNPVKIKGVAIKEPGATVETEEQSRVPIVETKEDVKEPYTEPLASTGVTVGDVLKHETVLPGGGAVDEGEHKKQMRVEVSEEIKPSSSSSSGSSEEDEQGGRRKKKGLAQKLKEKLHVGKHKEEHEHKGPVSTTSPLAGEHHEHEKKSVMEKIKEKLPGHHSE